MCGSMVDIQSPTAEIRRGNKKRRKKKKQHENMYVLPYYIGRPWINKAYHVLGIIKRNFIYMDHTSFLLLYKSMVHPHLEYANSVWFLYQKRDITEIEKVQKRATKLIISLKHVIHVQHLLHYWIDLMWTMFFLPVHFQFLHPLSGTRCSLGHVHLKLMPLVETD